MTRRRQDARVWAADRALTPAVAEQNANIALKIARFGYILETGHVVLEGTAEALRSNEDVREFYLGVAGQDRRSFKTVKTYKRRKRWLA